MQFTSDSRKLPLTDPAEIKKFASSLTFLPIFAVIWINFEFQLYSQCYNHLCLEQSYVKQRNFRLYQLQIYITEFIHY